MRTLIAHRPSPAMVVACIALLVALGGTSVAAVNAIAPNSIGTTIAGDGRCAISVRMKPPVSTTARAGVLRRPCR